MQLFFGVSSALFKAAVSGEVDNAAFVIEDTALPRCIITRWDGGGVRAAALAVPATDSGQFRPSPSHGPCASGTLGWKGGRSEMKSLKAIFGGSAMVLSVI
jgi:hypothetical protein